MGGIPVPLVLTISSLVLASMAAVVAASDLTVSVLTDADRWPAGTVIPLTVRIANTGRETVEIAFSNGCRASIHVHDAGRSHVAWLGRACTAGITNTNLAPGESIEIRYVWDQQHVDGGQVRVGVAYEARPSLYLLGPRPDLDLRYVSAVVRIS